MGATDFISAHDHVADCKASISVCKFRGWLCGLCKRLAHDECFVKIELLCLYLSGFPANDTGCDYDSSDFFCFGGVFASNAWDELWYAMLDDVRVDVR